MYCICEYVKTLALKKKETNTRKSDKNQTESTLYAGWQGD
jgi:hypothetical protein